MAVIAVDAVLVQRTDAAGVTTLTLDRPQARNALSIALMEALLSAIESLRAAPATRVVVIAANGPAFCAGHDLRELRADPCRATYERTFALCSQLMTAIVRLPKPVIARVHGIATAAGCQLVASCDLAIASVAARFATPGVNIGLFCSTPMVALSRAIPRKPAMEMLLTGEPIDAPAALRFGLVNRVVTQDALDAAVAGLAAALAAKSPRVLAIGKEAFYRQIELGLDEAYAYSGAVMVRNMMEDDAAEGLDAFLEKRAPHWRGS